MNIDFPNIPVVDLAAFLNGSEGSRGRIAADVDRICQRIGFLIIENHLVPEGIIDLAWRNARAFFDLPVHEKMKCAPANPGCPRGYFAMESEALAKTLGVDTPADRKESFGIGSLRAPPGSMSAEDFDFHYGDNSWPTLPVGMRQSLTDYFNAMETLGNRILTLFAVALGLEPNYFAPFHTYPMSALRCLNYPPGGNESMPHQRGAGEHSDYGSLTILKSDPHVAGLEIRLANGEWVASPLVDDAFIINIGDMLARWTNGRWVSTLHRVSNSSGQRRQSMAFFHNTNHDANIECIDTCVSGDEAPKFEPVSAGRYLVDRFKAAVE